MVKKLAASGRERGHIRRRGISYQVLVYAGVDPLTGRELQFADSTDEVKAKEILKPFRAQVDEQSHARTKATFRAAMEAWLQVHDIEETTARGRRLTPGCISNRRSVMSRSGRSLRFAGGILRRAASVPRAM